MRHQLFKQDELCPRREVSGRFTNGRINALDLHHLHLAIGAFLQLHLCRRVQYALAAAIALPIVLFYIADAGVFADVEGVNTVVLALRATIVVDAAAAIRMSAPLPISKWL